MGYKKRRKPTRWRGSHTHGRGFKKKARGSGHRGGVGMAGTGKRGDAKKTLILNLYGNEYFGKSRTLRRGTRKPKLKEMTLSYIQGNIISLVKNGLAKEAKGAYEINLKGYKVLGNTEFQLKANISASAASASAIESVQASGGSLEVLKVAPHRGPQNKAGKKKPKED